MATINSINSNIPIEISKGGTNATTMATNYGAVYYDGSKLVTVASAGASGTALTSNGAAAPTFQVLSGGSDPTESFYSYLSGNSAYNLTGDGTTATVPYNAERFDEAANFNTGTYTYTAGTTGYYYMTGVAVYATTSSNAETATNTGTTTHLRKSGPTRTCIVSGRGHPNPMNATTPTDIGDFGDGLGGKSGIYFLQIDAADTMYTTSVYNNSSLGKAFGFEAATNGARSFMSGYIVGT